MAALVPPAAPSPTLRRALARIVGDEHVSDRTADRIAYSHDLWPKTLIWMRAGRAPHPPDFVVWPGGEKEVIALLKLAQSESVPVVPYGAGAGVCGGVIPLQGGVTIDLKRMSRLVEVDGERLTAQVEPGIVGEPLERDLDRRGYTLGHFPSSIYCSSIGGFLASRSAGQLSTKYGKIEDMVLSLDAVLPGGRRIRVPDPSAGFGPDLLQIIVGSEGTLGVITRALLKVHRKPETIRFQAFLFRSLSAGLDAIREILRAGVRPAAVRLYDEFDTFLVGARAGGEEGEPERPGAREGDPGGLGRRFARALKPGLERLQSVALGNPALLNRAGSLVGRRCLLVLTFEGNPVIAQAEHLAAIDAVRKHGGEDRGPGPARKWWRGRYHVSYKLPLVFRAGAFADTIEVAARWDRVETLYREIRRRISPHAFIMAHFSHAYAEGCSIYFTFATARRGDAESEAAYDRIWEIAMATTLEVGGTIAHHHGIGMSKAKWMEAEHAGGMRLYRAVKEALDPKGIMNPGKMGL